MDTRLWNGDHYVDGRGLPVALAGGEEMVQRALLRLAVRRGSFPLEPELGSGLHKLRSAQGENLDRLAMGYVREALLPMEVDGVSVRSVGCTRRPGGAVELAVELEWQGESLPLVVEVGA